MPPKTSDSSNSEEWVLCFRWIVYLGALMIRELILHVVEQYFKFKGHI